VAQAAALTAQYQAALGALCQRYETRHAEGSAAIAQARHRCRTRGSRRVAVHRLCVACGSGPKGQGDALGARSVRHSEGTTELRTEAGHRQQVQAGAAAAPSEIPTASVNTYTCAHLQEAAEATYKLAELHCQSARDPCPVCCFDKE